MSKHNKYRILILLSFISLLNEVNSTAQLAPASSGDSLDLQQVIQTVIQSHPSVKLAEEALNAADAKIALAKSALMPNIDASASYTRLGPAPSLTLPLGNAPVTFQLFPPDNYNATLNFNETIYNFGKTRKNVDYETENRKLSEEGIEGAKQKLSLAVSNTFFTLVYLQEAINIKQEQINTLNEHLQFVQKKKETGSATEYEILTTQVKISANESQLIDTKTAFRVQMSIINTLMGLPDTMSHPVKKTFEAQMPLIKSDSMIGYAEENRYEMKTSKQMEVVSQFMYNMIKAQESPSINIFASGGAKNGYLPDLNVFTPNFAAGIGLRVPIFDGKRTSSMLRQASSSMKSASYLTELTHKNITIEVVESEANLNSSLKKLDQARLQLTQAEKAFNLAKVSYQSGAITNLDLLDATTSLSESRLALLKARIDHALAIYNLKLALGDKIY